MAMKDELFLYLHYYYERVNVDGSECVGNIIF